MFLTKVQLMEDTQPEMWVLTAPHIWEDSVFGRITAPVGFRTDLASTPLHLASNGLSRDAAVLHDVLYNAHGENGSPYDKEFADQFLKAGMIASGCPFWEAEEFYLAVRAFGVKPWDECAGGLIRNDFDTVDHYHAWQMAGASVIHRPDR